jgi:hypothetical protein
LYGDFPEEFEMKKLVVLTLCAGLVLSMPVASFADDPAQKTGVNAAAAGDAAKSMAAPSYHDFLSSYSNTLKSKVDLNKLSASTVVNVVKISSLNGFDDPKSLYAAMRVNKDALTQMQKMVTDNSALSGKIKAAGFTPADVVLLKADPSDAINVFVKDVK